MILLFFGPPGAGKGTQASLISKKMNIPHLSTGDILRNKLLENDSLSLKLKDIMDGGDLISDEIINEIVSNRLNRNDCKNGFILDGYPRTIKQKDFLEIFLQSNKLQISKIFDFAIDHETVIERIKLRSHIEQREDDKAEIIKTRILKYLKETKPLSEFYSQNYSFNYYDINGNQEIEKIQEDIMNILKK